MLPFNLTINEPWLDLVALRFTSHVKSLAREKSRESKAKTVKGVPYHKHEFFKGTKEYRVFVAPQGCEGVPGVRGDARRRDVQRRLERRARVLSHGRRRCRRVGRRWRRGRVGVVEVLQRG